MKKIASLIILLNLNTALVSQTKAYIFSGINLSNISKKINPENTKIAFPQTDVLINPFLGFRINIGLNEKISGIGEILFSPMVIRDLSLQQMTCLTINWNL